MSKSFPILLPTCGSLTPPLLAPDKTKRVRNNSQCYYIVLPYRPVTFALITVTDTPELREPHSDPNLDGEM